jgi:hypothetical protein
MLKVFFFHKFPHQHAIGKFGAGTGNPEVLQIDLIQKCTRKSLQLGIVEPAQTAVLDKEVRNFLSRSSAWPGDNRDWLLSAPPNSQEVG